MEYQIVEFFIVSFLVGLTGCLAPGPTLIATIQSSLQQGWRAGPLVTAGHILVEAFIAVGVILGFSYFFSGYTTYISFIGGIALILFGILTIQSSRTGIPQNSVKFNDSRPFYAGCLTAVSNPYFWLWWITVGAGFLLDGLTGGILFGVAFMTGHWLADMGWYTFISASIGKGRKIITEGIYRIILICCGFFLILFGLFFLISGYSG